jgi:hypothetical protein
MSVVYHRGGDLVGALNRMTKNIKLPVSEVRGRDAFAWNELCRARHEAGFKTE